jgi:hypothetical protein
VNTRDVLHENLQYDLDTCWTEEFIYNTWTVLLVFCTFEHLFPNIDGMDDQRSCLRDLLEVWEVLSCSTILTVMRDNKSCTKSAAAIPVISAMK